MAVSASYLSCGFCDLSHDPGDTHCISCGGNLDQYDSNDIFLALVTQVNTVFARKTKGFLDAHREMKMSFAIGVLCTVWMFGCLIIVNMQSFRSAVFGGNTTVAVQTIDESNGAALEPSLQAAVEGK